MSLETLGEDIVAAVGLGAARELLDAITRLEAERAALIGRLASRDDGNWLADLLSDLEVGEDRRSRWRASQVAPADCPISPAATRRRGSILEAGRWNS